MDMEASIASRQFALNYSEHPDAPKYKKLADDFSSFNSRLYSRIDLNLFSTIRDN